MAEAVLLPIAQAIIRTLTSLGVQEIQSEIKSFWGVKDELKKLENTVSAIQAVLRDAEEKFYSESHHLKYYVGQLKEALYDADDLLDDFYTEALRRKVMSGNNFTKEVRLFFSRSNQLAYDFKMAHKIKAIRDRLVEIQNNKEFGTLTPKPPKPHDHVAKGRKTHSFLPSIFFGRENEKEDIIKLLFSSNHEESVAIIPIVGIGGLGKTTLAQSVFGDDHVGTHFELKLWVCVSDNFVVELVLKKILKEANVDKVEDLDTNMLVSRLGEKIGEKKYLLVLDDIWNEEWEKWNNLIDPLRCGARGSRIIVTTRLDLKRLLNVKGLVSPYKLGGLPEPHSWNLFTQIAFEEGKGPISPTKEKIGKEVIRKCQGNPLAIKTIGRLFYGKNSDLEWETFKSEEFLKLGHGENDIIPTLELSYNYLSSDLKNCFAYCRLFLKDSSINVCELVDLWIAQGFINSSNSNCFLEDIGYDEYFKYLLWRSFFEHEGKDVQGDVLRRCKMHDLMHDLSERVAGPESKLLIADEGSFDEKTRHVSFQFNICFKWQNLSVLLQTKKLRTFYVNSSSYGSLKEEGELDVIFSNFKCLRTLKLVKMGIVTIPNSIYKLKHLRYLDLSHNYGIKILPDAVTTLVNLQVLKLEYCESLKQLPKGLKKLVNLKRLGIEGCWGLTHMPRGIGKLTNLRELSRFVVGPGSKHSGGLGELRHLNNLKGELELVVLDMQCVKKSVSEFKEANLKEKPLLQRLEIIYNGRNNADDDVDDSYDASLEALQPHPNLKSLRLWYHRGVKFPGWLSSLTNLTSIDITCCEKCKDIPPLHHLPSLSSLTIDGLSEVEYIENGGNWDTKGEPTLFFPSLKYLALFYCPNLKGWWPTSSSTKKELLPHFHCLSKLTISHCPNLTSMPQFPPLEDVELSKPSKEVVEQIFKVKIIEEASTSSSPSSSISQFKFQICPEDSLPHLSSLKSLQIYGFSMISGVLSGAMPRLTSLEHLSIGNCGDLNFMQGQCFPILRRLIIWNIPQLVTLPEGLQHATTLLTLDIEDCSNLISLPEWMVNLTSLQTLYISKCPQLSERCKNRTALDWPLIKHIPNIRIDFEDVQTNGQYKL